MDCSQAQEFLSPYLDGELDPRDTEAIKEHLHSCFRCREDYAALQDTVSIVSGLASQELTAPEGIRVAVLAGLEDFGVEKRPKRSRKWIFPAAAAAVLVLGFLWGNNLLELGVQPAQVAQKDFSQSEATSTVLRQEAAPENAGKPDNLTRDMAASAPEQQQMALGDQEIDPLAVPQEQSQQKKEPMVGIQGFAAEEGQTGQGKSADNMTAPVLTITGQPANRLEVNRMNIELVLQQELNPEFWKTYDAVVVKETATEISVELPQGNLDRLIEDFAKIGVVKKQERSTEDLSEELRQARIRMSELEQNSESDVGELAKQRELLAGLESMRDKVQLSVRLVQ